jgi:hypothetical protein
MTNPEEKTLSDAVTHEDVHEAVAAVKAAVGAGGILPEQTDAWDDLLFLSDHAERMLLSHDNYTTGGMTSSESHERAFVVDGHLCLMAYGDLWSDVPNRFLPVPDDAAQLVRLLATWVSDYEVWVPMAITLEAFDPDQVLDEAGQAVWRRRFENLSDTSRKAYDSVEHDLEDDVRTALCILLRENSDYRRAAEAMRRPDGPAGQALGVTIDRLEATGVISLVGGSWLTGDLSEWRERLQSEIAELRAQEGATTSSPEGRSELENLEQELSAVNLALAGLRNQEN